MKSPVTILIGRSLYFFLIAGLLRPPTSLTAGDFATESTTHKTNVPTVARSENRIAIESLVIDDIAVEKDAEGSRDILPGITSVPRDDAKAPAEDIHGPPVVTAKSWAVADGRTGDVFWHSQGDLPLKSASTTKIMCALVVLNFAVRDPKVLEERVTFSKLADSTMGSTAAIVAGESVTVRDCLYGLILPSGNDAGNALAEHFDARCAEPETSLASELSASNLSTRLRFVGEMNRTAQKLELRQTVYRLPYGDGGTPADRTTTAQDLARLGAHAMQNATFRAIVGTRHYEARVDGSAGETRVAIWKNTNELLSIEGYDGIKTGTTTQARACLVASGQREKQHLIVVILGAETDQARYVETRNLFRWAWSKRAQE